MRRTICAVAVAVVSLILATSGLARVTSHPSTLSVYLFAEVLGPSDDIFVAGHVDSPAARCTRNRALKVFFVYANEGERFRLVDVARSGRGGAFAGQGADHHNGNQAVSTKLVLKRKVVGRGAHRRICGGDTLVHP